MNDQTLGNIKVDVIDVFSLNDQAYLYNRERRGEIRILSEAKVSQGKDMPTGIRYVYIELGEKKAVFNGEAY